MRNAKFLLDIAVFFKIIAEYFKHIKDKNFKKCWTLTRLGVQKHHKKLVLCDVMIKDGTELFLDDTTISDVEKELDVKIMLTKNDGYDFTDCICDIDY